MLMLAQYIGRVQEHFYSGRYFEQVGPYNADMTSRKPSPVGIRIADLRKQAGLTQRQLAERIDTAWSNVAYWERGADAPPGHILPKLAEVLGTTADELLGIKPPKTKKTVAQGRLQRVFERVSNLPRRQQQKVIDMAEAFVAQHSNGNGS